MNPNDWPLISLYHSLPVSLHSCSYPSYRGFISRLRHKKSVENLFIETQFHLQLVSLFFTLFCTLNTFRLSIFKIAEKTGHLNNNLALFNRLLRIPLEIKKRDLSEFFTLITTFHSAKSFKHFFFFFFCLCFNNCNRKKGREVINFFLLPSFFLCKSLNKLQIDTTSDPESFFQQVSI